MREYIPLLSKSRFMTGLKCHKALYLSCYHYDLSTPPDASQQAIFDTGTKVGELARDIYPGGILITEDYLHHKQSVISTQKALHDHSTTALYEAGFLYDDIRIRADILVRIDNDLFDLIEVKSTTKTKNEHIPDVAVQLRVLDGCGISIRRACLGHLNNQYMYPGGEYDLSQLFQVDDITIEAKDLLPEIDRQLRDMRFMLGQTKPPNVKVGRQCSNPYDCAFQEHCHTDRSEHHLLQLPRVGKKVLAALDAAGIEDIRDIPVDFPGLNATQQRVRDCVVNNRVHIERDISEELRRLEFPIHFLDFETFNPALPLYPGTSPYKVIPFQWSNHILYDDGTIRHEEYLHDGYDDPREPFAKSLLQTLASDGPIVVYSSFEASRIKDLIEALPHLSAELHELFARFVDLLVLVRAHCYHPEFHGSFSIKSVLPALVPDLDYKDLEINDGGLASISYAEIISTDTNKDRREHLRKCLLNYCKRDTEAEVCLYKTLVNNQTYADKKRENNVDLIYRINQGESKKLEFKSTLRWNLFANKADKEMEYMVLKTIAAFCNTDGGELLIGISDTGSVLGIESDKFPNQDKFLLHLGNILDERIEPLVVDLVDYDIINVDGHPICQVICKKSTNEAIWLKKGKDQYEFYVRTGPSSKVLPTPKAIKYIKKHFDQPALS
ncbi:MAG: DUF2779 domain-containing protein [Chloroflexi bacterium]|nr:DUF2779 domain-containing protein [Chloroflexota bacterium]